MKNLSFTIGITTIVLTGCTSAAEVEFTEPPSRSSSSSSIAATSSASSVAPSSVSQGTTPTEIPNSVRIQVPFSSQAPFAVWDELHEETCEEMALIMVQRYLTKGTLDADSAEAELQKIVAWETEHGYGYDVNMDELAEIARDFYGLEAEVVTNVTKEKIKEILASGSPVIIPAAGRQLGNPYFSGEGPWYHALTLIGYEGDTFIANDPGTKRGQNYRYSADVIMNAIHDWTGVKEEIATGRKAILIVRN